MLVLECARESTDEFLDKDDEVGVHPLVFSRLSWPNLAVGDHSAANTRAQPNGVFCNCGHQPKKYGKMDENNIGIRISLKDILCIGRYT